MENEYINQDTLKALLVRLANMYNSLNSSISTIITWIDEEYITTEEIQEIINDIDTTYSGFAEACGITE